MFCTDEVACKNSGWQWLRVESCKGCEVKHCTKCDSDDECTKCKSGFAPNKKGTKCMSEDDDNCQVKHCTKCDSDNECTKCKSGFEPNRKGTKCLQSDDDHCNGINEWTVKIANGQIAPWTYKAGDVVHHEKFKYRAMSGGQEVPGTHVCTDEVACNGWQWLRVEHC